MKKFWLAPLTFMTFTISTAQAVELKGADDPQFQGAIEAWLNDDDANSLPLLAKLANEGNVAARLTLSGIETTHIKSTTAYFKSLSRKERKSLMRADGGLSGTPWVRIEAEAGNKFAKTLQETQAPEIKQATVRGLINLGEYEAASRAMIRMLNYGYREDLEVLAEDNLVPLERRYLVWQTATLTGNKAFLKEANDALKRGDPLSIMAAPNPKENAQLKKLKDAIYNGHIVSPYITEEQETGLKKWLIEEPAMVPITSLCQAECPSQFSACTAMTYRLINGYHNVTNHDTPLETVISQKEFLKSSKSRNSLLRYILDKKQYLSVEDRIYFLSYPEPTYQEDIENASSCLAQKLRELDS